MCILFNSIQGLSKRSKGIVLSDRFCFLMKKCPCVGLFNTKLRRGIFNDWYLRALELGLQTHMMPDLLMRRRLHRTNHGIVNRDKSVDYVRALKASLDRRRT